LFPPVPAAVQATELRTEAVQVYVPAEDVLMNWIPLIENADTVNVKVWVAVDPTPFDAFRQTV